MLQTAIKNVKPSGCGCGTSAALPRAPVYVVGSLGFDFGTEGRRDALFAANGGAPILTGAALASFLAANPWDAASVIWTLSDDQYPIYAIRPTHAYGADAYLVLRNFLASGVDRISVPGWISGSARLMNGWVVPVIEPDVQGMRSWSTSSVVGQINSNGGLIDVAAPMPVGLPDKVQLQEIGTADWAYWKGPTALDVERSSAGHGQISNLTEATIPQQAPTQLTNPQLVFAWDGGAPTATGASATALAIPGVLPGEGFKFTAPADADTHTLYLYVTVKDAVGTLLLSLSDGSANPVTVSTSGDGVFLFKITYRGVKAGQLSVQFTASSVTGGSPELWIHAAALETSAAHALNTNQGDLQNFLDRIYFELRNKGVSPEERARNFAATQAYFVNNVITYAVGHGLNLQGVSVGHSPLCRPGSECWDVTLSFFDPQNPSTSAHKVFRFIVDVSDVKPVMIGPMYRWNSY